MARPRQKSKNRSSLRRVTQKPKKTLKPLLANPIIAKHWDRSATLSQNYKRLGLVRKVNRVAGGVEGPSPDELPRGGEAGVQAKDRSGRRAGRGMEVRAEVKQVKVGEARIVRDPATGTILRVIEAGQEEEPNAAPKNKAAQPSAWKALDDPLADLDEMVLNANNNAAHDDEEDPFEGFESDQDAAFAAHTRTSIVRQLEKEASVPSAPKKRKQSDREKQFLKRLVEKYGADEERYPGCFGRMSRDTTGLNPMQQSEGDLRRRVGIYLKGRG